MSWKVVAAIGKTYSLLLMVAIGGIVFANVAGLVEMILAHEWKAENVRPWMHGGWIFGAAFGLLGGLTGRLRFYGANTRLAKPTEDSTAVSGSVSESESVKEDDDSNTESKKSGLFPASRFSDSSGRCSGSCWQGHC